MDIIKIDNQKDLSLKWLKQYLSKGAILVKGWSQSMAVWTATIIYRGQMLTIEGYGQDPDNSWSQVRIGA